jgi:hypothetical protein
LTFYQFLSADVEKYSSHQNEGQAPAHLESEDLRRPRHSGLNAVLLRQIEVATHLQNPQVDP